MKRILIRLLLAGLSLLPLTACDAGRLAERIRIEGVERVRTQGFTRLQLVLRVANGTGRNLRLKEATLAFYPPEASEAIATAVLAEPVVVRRRTTGAVDTRWRIEYARALAWMPLLRALEGGTFDGWWVSVRLKGRSGLVSANISEERVPLSLFLRTFGIDSTSVANTVNP